MPEIKMNKETEHSRHNIFCVHPQCKLNAVWCINMYYMQIQMHQILAQH